MSGDRRTNHSNDFEIMAPSFVDVTATVENVLVIFAFLHLRQDVIEIGAAAVDVESLFLQREEPMKIAVRQEESALAVNRHQHGAVRFGDAL